MLTLCITRRHLEFLELGKTIPTCNYVSGPLLASLFEQLQIIIVIHVCTSHMQHFITACFSATFLYIVLCQILLILAY